MGDLRKFNGCDLLIESLVREGVEVAFAYPGGSSMEIHQALHRNGKIRVILPRHEQAGAFGADGYARATGKVGVCMATSGPGATNLITGIANAYMDSIPLVSITGQVSQSMIGRNAFQETDFFGMTVSICKYSYLVTDVTSIPRIVKEAFYLARTGRPGPVVIDIPKNIQQAIIEMPKSWDISISLRGYIPEKSPTDEQLLEVLKMIEKSHQPIICAGGGVTSGNASEELREFVRLTQIPVATTILGLGTFPEEDPLSLRWAGMHGSVYANKAISQSDLFIAMGNRFNDRVTGSAAHFAPNAKIVHLDIDPSEINKNRQTDFAISCNIKEALSRLNKLLKTTPLTTDFSAWHKQILQWKKEQPFSYKLSREALNSRHINKLHHSHFEEVIMPQQAIQMLYEMTKGNAIVVTGVGQHQMWTAQYWKFDKPRHFISSGGLGSMGFGYPAALGVKLGCPEKEVIDIDGDGSFQMNIQELATAKVEDLPVKAIILNNQYLGMVVQLEDRFYAGVHANTFIGDPTGENTIYPDFVKIAEGYSIKAERVVFKKDLKMALQRMLDSKEPYLLDIITPNTLHVLPFIKSGGSVNDMVTEGEWTTK